MTAKRRRGLVVVALAVAVGLIGCASERAAADYGQELFSDPSGLTPSRVNTFSCATCHHVQSPPEDDRLLPGHDLVGVAARERYWGGQTIRLKDAVDACLVYFMRGTALDEKSDEARALYEYLAALSPPGSPSATRPMTVVENIVAIPPGDAGRGDDLYRRACANCHGDVHTAKGSILERTIVLPEVTGDYDRLFPGVPKGLVVTEVVRHGRFFDVGTTMAHYSLEVLSDAQLGDILAFLGTPTQ
jgi:thiosulfate dehydrogenase